MGLLWVWTCALVSRNMICEILPCKFVWSFIASDFHAVKSFYNLSHKEQRSWEKLRDNLCFSTFDEKNRTQFLVDSEKNQVAIIVSFFSPEKNQGNRASRILKKSRRFFLQWTWWFPTRWYIKNPVKALYGQKVRSIKPLRMLRKTILQKNMRPCWAKFILSPNQTPSRVVWNTKDSAQ
jgi:hypothetical protein